jgi:DNA-3-methyladenine glycosylase
VGERGLTIRRPHPRRFYDRPVLEVAQDLLGSLVAHSVGEQPPVVLRITEVEAYAGGHDPASHAFRGPTPRNSVMFGPPGHAYVYFTYGMHFCVNLVVGPPGQASAVLLRAGEVVDGIEAARSRRPGAADRDLARGPARLTKALGIDREHNGLDVTRAGSALAVGPGVPVAPDAIRWGPRVGVSAAAELPWRAWIHDEPTVSSYRAHVPRRRSS